MHRRLLLSLIAGTIATPGLARGAVTSPPRPSRLRLVNPHTAETFEGSYRDENGPLASVMAQLAFFLRDFHSGATITIDVGVLDFLTEIMAAIGANSALILSAYRTPETNAMLAKTTFGVAENSQHLYGRALDVCFPERLADAMVAAREMKRGGVGWYPNSGFIHIDTGPVRNWDLDDSGLGALLFNGRRVKSNRNGQPNSRDHDLVPAGLEQSGQMLPGMKQSGQLLPQVEGSGRVLPGLAQSGRALEPTQLNRLPILPLRGRAVP